MGLTAIVDLLRTLTAIVDWESRVALTPVPLGACLADLDSHESQASLLSHSLLGDQIQKVNCATECEDMPITSSTSSFKLCGWAPVLFCELTYRRSISFALAACAKKRSRSASSEQMQKDV